MTSGGHPRLLKKNVRGFAKERNYFPKIDHHLMALFGTKEGEEGGRERERERERMVIQTWGPYSELSRAVSGHGRRDSHKSSGSRGITKMREKSPDRHVWPKKYFHFNFEQKREVAWQRKIIFFKLMTEAILWPKGSLMRVLFQVKSWWVRWHKSHLNILEQIKIWRIIFDISPVLNHSDLFEDYWDIDWSTTF